MKKFINKTKQLLSIKILSAFGYFYFIPILLMYNDIKNRYGKSNLLELFGDFSLLILACIIIYIIIFILVLSGTIEYFVKRKRNKIKTDNIKKIPYFFLTGIFINILFIVISLYMFSYTIIMLILALQ